MNSGRNRLNARISIHSKMRHIIAERYPTVTAWPIKFRSCMLLRYQDALLRPVNTCFAPGTVTDFSRKLLIDLILTRAGWQRLSALGKTQKSIDLEMLLPTGRRAFVQVKAQASPQELKDYINQYRNMDQYDEILFIETCSVIRIARLMRSAGIKARHKRRLSANQY